MRFTLGALICWIATISAAAPVPKLSQMTLNSAKMPSPPRWLFESHKVPIVPASIKPLAEAQLAKQLGNWSSCAQKAHKGATKEPRLAAWATYLELLCALEIKGEKQRSEMVAGILSRVDQHGQWWQDRAYRALMKKNFVKAALALLTYDLKSNRSRAWAGLNRLTQMEGDLSLEEKAELYRYAGELAFVEQKLDAAALFFQRSLKNKFSPEARDRLAALKTIFHEDSTGANLKTPKSADVITNRAESELYDRITLSLRQGDLLPAAEDEVKLIRSFPGSARADWASERLLEGFMNILNKSDPRYAALKDRYIGQMMRADSPRLFDWAKKLYTRGFYPEALQLAIKAESGYQGTTASTGVISLEARAALATDDQNISRDKFQILADEHSGTPEAAEALFHLGLMEFQKKNYSAAAAQFERLLVVPQADLWELSARYWLWRSLKSQKSNRAQEQSEILIQKFPFSYYGLRARAETGQSLEWKTQAPAAKYVIWMTEAQKQRWEKVDLLLDAGLWEEAQAELREIPPPVTAQSKALMAFYWAAALDYAKATELINEAWDEQPDLRNPPYLALSFPKEFTSAIQNYSQKNRISSWLVQSLIKQESAYGMRAVSSSGALGLMQLIPPTAQEVAQALDRKALNLPDDMFQFETNIRMGTYYLGTMLDKYHNSVPLALAAYNAGPARLDRWLTSRPSLNDLKDRHSSSPADELWIEELPWGETRFYVKAILRNAIIYQMLDQGRVQLPEPIWANLVKDRMQAQFK